MKKAPVIHPFFFALFPILALYAHNIKSIPVPLKELAGPLVVSLACTVALFVLLRALIKDPTKAGLIVSFLVLWFLSFGHLAGQIAVLTEGIYNRSLFFATALLVGVCGFLVVRSRRTFGGLTRVLNAVAVTLVVFNVFTTAQTLARRHSIAPVNEIKVSGQATARPNIYYIVLDAYTRADILKEVFSYDNSEFLAGLEKRGFIVADRSYANYNLTQQSLASSLNFTLLDSLAKDVGAVSFDRGPLYAMIRENRAMAFLKAQGYRLIAASSSIEPTDFKRADRYFGFARSDSEFRGVLLGTTPLALFARSREDRSPYDAHRGRILNVFRALEESPREKGPFFMFVHIMAPHPPFVFGADGEPVEPDYLFSMVDADRLHGGNAAALPDYIARYRAQLAFLNTKLLGAFDSILKGSPEPPLMVLQGDHGSRTYADLDRPEASYFKENLAILNAFHLPGGGRPLVYPSISPVNTFRLIFKHYFGAELDLLEDASFWTTWRRPYRFLPFDEVRYEATVGSVRDEMKPEAPAIQKR
ncbi:MAG: hypothetical protein EHM31_04405 [Candidatus Aminicenantes bacterium]|nr:MAG: hypothetical protein EHM31_04405 [Candidatus Aminicenantes bacterium]